MRRSRLVLALVLLAGLYAYLGPDLWTGISPERPVPERPAPTAPGAPEAAGRDDVAIADAFESRRSDVWVESAGVVERLLADDRKGSRHQRFIVRLEHGQTLLLSHNIDLAPRVPLDTGDRVRFRGEYEWNERGGVVHWTHRDPAGRHRGGWIEHRGRRYR
jgi:hypothetical protein